MKKNEVIKAKGLDAIRDQLFRSSLYGFWINRKRSFHEETLDCAPLIWGKEAKLIQKNLFYANQKFELNETLWDQPLEYEDIAKWLHGFQWLGLIEDLHHGESLILSWLEEFSHWQFLIWNPEVLSHRIQNWIWFLSQADKHLDPHKRAQICHSLNAQCLHLIGHKHNNVLSCDRILVRYGQIYAAAFLEPQKPDRFLKGLLVLQNECEKQVLPDGGPITRNPQDLFNILEVLERTKKLCEIKGLDFPIEMRNMQERIYPLYKTLITPSQNLPLFHGAQEGISAQKQRIFNEVEPTCNALMNARHSGYQKLEASQTTLLMDCGRPVDPKINPKAAPSTFAFELWDGETKLISNCGSFTDGTPEWQDALISSKAHSCLVIDEQDMKFASGIDQKQVHVVRISEKSNILIDAEHEGYMAEFGILHRRALFMDQSGYDIRIEDQLIGTGGNRFEIHLHLHPDIEAKKSLDEKNTILQMKSGVCWAISGAPVQMEIQESVYFGKIGKAMRTEQIILSGPLRGEGALIKWRLHRLGRSLDDQNT